MKEETLQKLKQEKQVLADLLEEEASLKLEEKAINDRLVAIADRLRQLRNRYSGTGEIPKAKAHVNRYQTQLSDYDALPVHWLVLPSFRSSAEKQYVVSRVTKKRIYIREFGDQSEVYFDRETGVRDKWSGQIDIATTFPDGIENFK